MREEEAVEAPGAEAAGSGGLVSPPGDPGEW